MILLKEETAASFEIIRERIDADKLEKISAGLVYISHFRYLKVGGIKRNPTFWSSTESTAGLTLVQYNKAAKAEMAFYLTLLA